MINYIREDGKLTRVERPEGNTHYRYQQGDQLAEVQEGQEKALYQYDGTLLTRLRYEGALTGNIDFGYNNDFQVNSLSYAGSSTNIDYDADGLVTALHGYSIDYHPDHGLPQQLSRGQWNQNWQWNAYGEVESVTYRHGTQARYGYHLEHNALGQIVSRTEQLPDGSTVTYDYHYDNRTRLTEVRENGQITESYGYDANGNRISHTSVGLGINNQTATYTSGDQLQGWGDTTYQYDANGRLSGKLTETENGLELTTYQYDSEGHLVQVDTPEQAISYRHNALGNRVAKLIDGQVTEYYLWQDLTTLLAIYDGQGNLKQRFEYTLGHTPTSFTQNGQRYFIQTDHLGSPRVITDNTGNVLRSLSYDSYGNIINDSNPDFDIPFGFAGGLYDTDTGLIRFGVRDYDPETGRWTARDPIGFAGGDTNLYGYVSHNPINFVDQLGLFQIPTTSTQFQNLQGQAAAQQAQQQIAQAKVWAKTEGWQYVKDHGIQGSIGLSTSAQSAGAGASAQISFAADNRGNMCLISTICMRAGPGASGGISAAVSLGKGGLCSGTSYTNGGFYEGGKGAFGGLSFDNNGSMTTAVDIGLGYGVSAGAQMCRVEAWCF